jgi:hypothetical protein
MLKSKETYDFLNSDESDRKEMFIRVDIGYEVLDYKFDEINILDFPKSSRDKIRNHLNASDFSLFDCAVTEGAAVDENGIILLPENIAPEDFRNHVTYCIKYEQETRSRT